MPIVVLGAVAAGVATTAFAVSATTIAMVGLGATVVGKLTKSKELMQFGSGLSLGAGISSAISGLTGAAAGGTSAAAGTAEAGSAAMENVISSADLAGIDAAAGGIGGGASLPDAISISTAWDAPATAIESFSGAASGTSGAASGGSGLLGSSLSSTPQAGTPLSATPQASLAPGSEPLMGQSAVDQAGAAITKVAPPPATDTGSIAKWWSSQSETVKNRILQMGGQAVGGMFDGWSSEQKLALQREQQNLEKQRYDQTMANGSAQPKLQFKQYQPQATGLLGSSKG